MKTTSFTRLKFVVRTSFYIVILLFISLSVFPGDAFIYYCNINQIEFYDAEKPIEILFKNDEDFDVTDLSVSVTIWNATPEGEWEVDFQWSQEGLTLPANSTLPVTTEPMNWTADHYGTHYFGIESYSPVDIDLSNNNLEYYFYVMGSHYFTFEQYDISEPFQNENSTLGVFGAHLYSSEIPYYINVMAQNPVTETSSWIVKNLPVLPFDSEHDLYTPFNLGTLDIEQGENMDSINIAIRLDPLQLTHAFHPGSWHLFSMQDFNYNVVSLNEIFISNIQSEVPIPPDTIQFEEVSVTDSVYHGCKIPSVDLDSSHYHPNGYAGDYNACGPAAASNSLQWLERTHEKIDSTSSHREKMMELSGMMDRKDTSGVTTKQFIRGKLAYIDKYKLPIHVKYQSCFNQDNEIESPNSSYGHSAKNMSGTPSEESWPTWEFLKNELKKGEDVEIMFGWYDAEGKRHGGHFVTVSGMVESGMNKGIYSKDDQNQSSAGGTRELYLPWITEGEKSRLGGFRTINNQCWVESVISESYDSTLEFKTLYDEAIEWVKWGAEKLNPVNIYQAIFSADRKPSGSGMYLNAEASMKHGQNSEWIIRNVFLPPGQNPQRLNIWLDLGVLVSDTAELNDSVLLKVSTDSIYHLMPDFKYDYSLILPVQRLEYDPSLGDEVVEPEKKINPGLAELGWGSFVANRKTTWHYRGDEIPDIDLDSSRYNPVSVPGYAGDYNACGPAAASNSMQWLERTHKKIDSTSAHREKMVELSGLMNRKDREGVYRKDFIKAKLAYIDKYKLPIHVKFQGFKFDTSDIASPDTAYGHKADNMNDSSGMPVQWDWLVGEMERGEDVEMSFGYYDTTGRKFGHWVTISGVSEVGEYKGLYVKDDLHQKIRGGTREQFVNWKISSAGYPFLDQFCSDKYQVWVEAVVSESYDSTITFEPIDTGSTFIKGFLQNFSPEIKIYNNPGKLSEDIILEYSLSGKSTVNILVFDLQGRQVASIKPGQQLPGKYQQHIPGSAFPGNGEYLIQLQMGESSYTEKVIIH